MSTIHYKTLFNAVIEHDFYKDRISRSLSISPTLRCAKIISHLGLRIEAQAGGVSVYCDAEQDVVRLLQQVRSEAETDCFEFTINSNDHGFYNYTDLPIQPRRQALYFSGAGPDDADTNRCYLGQLIFAPDTLEGDQPIAKLKIYFSDLPAIHVGEAAVDFVLVFKARSAYWKYYLVAQNPDELAGTEITDNDGIAFAQSSVRETLPGGQEAWVYSCQRQFVFSDTPKYLFDLVRQVEDSGGGDGEATVLLKGLPSADPAELVVAQDGDAERVYCPIYVYL